MNAVYQTMSDGASVAVYTWLPEQAPKAVLHMVHGMAEHAARYDDFAKIACKRGVAVVAADHRGHGKTGAKSGLMGYLADRDGFGRVVDDQKEINEEIRKQYPGLPIVIIGHSFGSFVTQEYIERYGTTVKAAVLIGSAGPNPSVFFASLLANLNCAFKGRKSAAKFMNALVFGSYNKRIKRPRTAFDWLSRDEKEVKKYIDDEYCGFVCTAGFFQDFMRGLKRIHTQAALTGIPTGLPVLITAGLEDPVSNGGKTLKTLYRLYQDMGMQDVALKLYENARHEILNETNKEEVKADILGWIEKKI
ncbi:MAG: alpha/beta hydrolase [Selenomonas massiliensis]